MTSEPDRVRAFAQFLVTIGRLKQTPRTGWLDREIPADLVESVADHSFRVAMLAWLAAADIPELDSNRVLKLALIHDMAEALTGDITPNDVVEVRLLDPAAKRELLNRRQKTDEPRRRQKHFAEDAAMTELLADLSPVLSKELGQLWNEMRDRKTPEARFVKEADILETYIQSRQYLMDNPESPMNSFALEAGEEIANPLLRSILDAIKKAD